MAVLDLVQQVPGCWAVSGQSKARFVHSDQESAARGIHKVNRAQIHLHSSAAQHLEGFAPALLYVFDPRANELPLQSKDNCVFPFVDSDAQHSKRTALPWQFAFQSRTSTDVVGEIDLVGDGALKQG